MEKKREIFFILVLITVLVIIYQHTFKYSLIWDTQTFINESVLLKNDMSPLSAFKYGYIYGQLGMQEQSFYYRPLVNMSFMLEKRLWGLKNTTLRLTNLFIFILTIIFLYRFLSMQSEDERFPLVAIVLFSLSPLNMENIVWVVGRCDLFVMLWGVLTLLCFQLFLRKKRMFFLLATLFFYALGIFSKETFLFFWPLLVIFQLLREKRFSWIFHLSTALITMLFFWIKTGLLNIGNMHFLVASDIWGYIQSALSVAGYYFRILIFPFYFDNFSFVNKITTTPYLVLGILFLVIVLLGIYVSRKTMRDIFPVLLTIIFLIPYVMLAFSTLWPFRISSRYMMASFLGVVWLASTHICRLKVRLQNLIVVSLIILFGSTLISGMQRYRSERAFWEDALKSHPENSFVMLKMAGVYYTEKDDFTSLYYYSRALRSTMGKTTAIEISIGIAKLSIRRGDLQKALEWLNRLQFELQPYQQFQVVKLKADIYLSQGRVNLAEKILMENIERFGQRREIYQTLYEMYVGFEMWERAREMEKLIKQKFQPARRFDALRTRENFLQINTGQKIDFYVKHKNYSAAIGLLERQSQPGMEAELLKIELYYRMGNASTPQQWVEQIFRKYPYDFELRNRIGYFYLRRMRRLNDSILCFGESLRVQPGQTGIRKLYNYLCQQREKLGAYVL